MTEFISSLVTSYVNWVKAMPIVSSMIQFAILGTLGEVVSKWIVRKSFRYPFTFLLTLWKMIVWAILAVGIKYAFSGHSAMVAHLVEVGMLPALNKFGMALAISISLNVQFGLLLVIMHRVLANLVEKEKNWKGMDKSMYSLLWFWIPAHTVTFLLSDVYRIGLAALWSVALGLILGMFNKK